MAYYMRRVLGGTLYVDMVDVNARYLPSPESLRRKILVKVSLAEQCRGVYCELLVSTVVSVCD